MSETTVSTEIIAANVVETAPVKAKGKKGKKSEAKTEGLSLREIKLSEILHAEAGSLDYDYRLDMKINKDYVADMKKNGFRQEYPVTLRAEGSGFEIVDGRQRVRCAEAAGLETVWALVHETEATEADALADVLSGFRANAKIESDPWTRAQNYYRASVIIGHELAHEVIAEAESKSPASVLAHLDLWAFVQAVPDAVVQTELIESLREGKVTVSRVLEAGKLNAEEMAKELAGITRAVKAGLSPKKKGASGKPVASVSGLSKSESRTASAEVMMWDIKGKNAEIVKAALQAAFQVASGDKQWADLKDFAEVLAK